MKAFRWILKILLAVIMLVVLAAVLDWDSRRKKRTYKPAHAIINAAWLLNEKAEERIQLNKGNLEIIKRTQDCRQPTQKDSAAVRDLIREAGILRRSARWLFRNIQEDTTFCFSEVEREFGWFKEVKGAPLEEAQFIKTELQPSEGHAAKFRNRLTDFLALTAPYPKTPAAHRQYEKLRKLADLDPEEFYEAVFGAGEPYLQFAEITIVRSAIAGVETASLEHLKARSEPLSQRFLQTTWLAYVPNFPEEVVAGDTLRFTARLAQMYRMHPQMQPVFAFPDGRIDSVQDNTLAYVSFPAGKFPQGNHHSPERALKKKYSIRFSNSGRDTSFAGEIKYFLRKPQSN